jgi:LCP family protein required for cell wall assembly
MSTLYKVRRRRIKWARVLVILVILTAFVASIAGAAMYAYVSIFHNSVPTVVADNKNDTPNKQINVLLLGLDNGDSEISDSPRRSDTMVVASVNLDDGSIHFLAIPRDTKVHIPGQKDEDKITHAFAYGGPELSVKTVKEAFNIPIHYYAVLDWQGFIKVINVLGGVDMYVENDMAYDDPYDNLSIRLTKGYQHLDGEKAGEYVRFRHDELGDIGRVQRQQRFLKALSKEMLQFGTILKMPKLISTAKENIHTDMPLSAVFKLANGLKGVKTGKVNSEMIPGNFANINGVSYWLSDKEQTKKLVDTMFDLKNSKLNSVSLENK